MAEDKQQRTEPATTRRREEARKRGQVTRSVEVNSAVILLAVKLSAPIIGVLFLTEIAMAFVARTVPQINVFLVGFPVRIGLGLIFLSFTFPTLMYLSKNLFMDMEKNIMIVLKLLNG